MGKVLAHRAHESARPKIADYPFTTLVPNLGMVRAGEYSYVVADVPGYCRGRERGQGPGPPVPAPHQAYGLMRSCMSST